MSEFDKVGYVVAPNLLTDQTRDVLFKYMTMISPQEYDEVGTWGNLYSDFISESILSVIQPSIEEITGLSLLPTYSFIRLYKTGSILPPHTDNPPCEVGCSMTIGYEADKLWPLLFHSEKQEDGYYDSDSIESVLLDRGESVVYKGTEVSHSRECFDGVKWAQMFLHWVDANGSYTEYKYDGRRSLGLPYRLGRDRRTPINRVEIGS